MACRKGCRISSVLYLRCRDYLSGSRKHKMPAALYPGQVQTALRYLNSLSILRYFNATFNAIFVLIFPRQKAFVVLILMLDQ